MMAVASIELLNEGDTDFHWDADIGIAADILDGSRGRVHLGFNYEAVLGDELQPFDPRLGNYTLDTLGTFKYAGFEVGLLLHHVSRHLGDRPKRFGIAWNDLGAVVMHTGSRGLWRWQLRGLVARTVLHDFVDYRGDAGASATLHRTLRPSLSLVTSAGGHARFVADSGLDRGTQTGGRVEAGLRVNGRRGAVEAVVGFERRVDADPFEFTPRQWVFAGLRLVTP
jgi:hypothetical protein